ncbi:hypothetical protein [Streptomyces uncialis]|uniref:hypothetical protein n=1 Tax=Streptomyces uncialis TaxID=1048205 RepID=UPI00225449A1|nr:hypothetical protein [Streptomyces uncialis]MCX4660662.1 hypothetical protein [Streptomyces uncialis]
MGERGTGRGEGDHAGHASRPDLRHELRDLGRSYHRPGPDQAETMVERVLAQILAEGAPVLVAEPPPGKVRLRRWLRMRWRMFSAAFCGLLTVAVLTPPVRATVGDWFGFSGVRIQQVPSARPPQEGQVPPCEGTMSLSTAAQRAGFAPVVPAALGVPDGVQVTSEPGGRFLISLCWDDGGSPIRLDEFPARLDTAFTKTVTHTPDWLEVRGGADRGHKESALWFSEPHRLTFWMEDATGASWSRSERTSGPTLLWALDQESDRSDRPSGPSGQESVARLTLRLEGVASRDQAVRIAESVAPRK